MARLITDPNLAAADDIYEKLIAMHGDRPVEESLKLAARLNLILLNHIGDRAVAEEAIALAAQSRG
ncbi:DUF2783 domain-containing protein [Sphingomonas koreensis]|jgi:hypothetical protein|uniref:DUF2783 domain-containing protein n=1 Tax=Sphingomonas koreensis TaxID=93064 RepID=A0A1L6J8F2_9SPHN|nr:DUF2783 domain-containing protein [Sphingomonas koreensis]APR52164.1 hypothetical protein BRX40_06695 [Sphingomonas koreensis]MDC7812340.1 DUF2783 domain-containing protein [Sphingomonas koreensis]PJI88412.1 uncharacterized protein DUF2783 [Sphingomonas koreensis]RSU22972.1 DUF2783 domain-containing protein [Sphingomonas koreensis]RSU26837.1 DUF2783 domain-containing protein [Sphingomonas koreensis]